MTKTHCERCDTVIDHEGAAHQEVSRTVIEDQGQPNEYGSLVLLPTLKGFDGHNWRNIDLCRRCTVVVLSAAIIALQRD